MLDWCPMPASSPHWKRPPETSAEAIWEIADAVLGPNGQVRLEDVAEATGIPRATVYYYFPGRDPFVQWLVHEELDRAATAVQNAGTAERAVLALFDRWRSRPAVARRLLDGVGSEAWSALRVALGGALGGATDGDRPARRRDIAAVDALLGAVLASALAGSSTRADVRRLAATLSKTDP